jgi:RNA polymerase sigma-70 factor (ECF subfamily)
LDIDEEKILVKEAKVNREAFGLLYDAYYTKIFGYVQRRTADISSAEEITSDVFCRALENIKRYEWRNIPFSAWLYRIASNEIVNHYRRENRNNHHTNLYIGNGDNCPNSLKVELSQAQDEMKTFENYLDLHRGISRLPVKYQEVIVLRFFEEKQLNEIALIMRKSENTVKTLLYRGLARLRRILNKEMPDKSSTRIDRR